MDEGYKFLADLKKVIEEMGNRLEELRFLFDIPKKVEEINKLEEVTLEPGFGMTGKGNGAARTTYLRKG